MSKNLRIVTLNMLDDKYLREKRLALACQQIKKLNPDVLMLQEVALEKPFLAKLKKQLPGYHLSTAARGGRYSGYGLATLTRQKPLKNEELRLSQKRVALKTTLKVGTKSVDFINVHLFFSPAIDKPRQRQVKQILRFVERPGVVAGDFNALGRFRSIRLMKKHYASAHHSAHGQEPAKTYPTPLWRGRGVRHSLRRSALRASSVGHYLKKPTWGWTIDYIFVNPSFTVKSCELAFTEPSGADKSLFASDHFGLVVDLLI